MTICFILNLGHSFTLIVMLYVYQFGLSMLDGLRTVQF